MITLPKEIKTKTVISTALKLEMKDINNDISVQSSYKKNVISRLREYVCGIDYQETDSVVDDVSSINTFLKKCDNNVYLLEKLLSILLDIKVSSRENTISQSLKNISDYNDTYKSSYETINSNIEKIDKFLNASSNVVSENVKEKNYEDNTLIISETDNKVILPYSLSEIYDLLKTDSKYTSVDDVINKLYTRPLKYYKNAPVARFKEAYNLIIKRENGTKKEALDLAFELMLNKDLHPAIITACKSLDVLDIYLSCLEYNELDDFHFFKVSFKIPPALSLKKSLNKKTSNKKIENPVTE